MKLSENEFRMNVNAEKSFKVTQTISKSKGEGNEKHNLGVGKAFSPKYFKASRHILNFITSKKHLSKGRAGRRRLKKHVR